MNSAERKMAYIVTGTTRGIGQALAEEIIRRGHFLYSISRAPEVHGPMRHNYTCDLRDGHQIAEVLSRLMKDVPPSAFTDLSLINNAGMLEPIGFLGKHTPAQMADLMHVNLMAPMLIMALFISASCEWSFSRRIINISSGAALHPYAGWSLYCCAKAALNMLTRCAALEQQARPNGVSISAVAPGVVQTTMQALIRESKEADFPARPRFIKLQGEGLLADAAEVAKLLLDLDAAGQLRSGGVYDLRTVEWREGKPFIDAVVQG